MKLITEELYGRDFSSETISRYAGQLDAEPDACRNRPFAENYPYVTIDARYDNPDNLLIFVCEINYHNTLYTRF
jgi:transposase-like protein